MYDELKSSGITTKTPDNIMLGAGTIHKGFQQNFTKLTVEPDDWATNYKDYFEKVGSDYVEITGDVAPDFTLADYYKAEWNFSESLIGATSGGSKVSIVPETTDIEVDGALVAVKGLRVKMGETANIEVNFVEMTPEMLQMVCIGEIKDDSSWGGYSEITSKPRIEKGDYIENFAYVGRKSDGTPIIIIFDQCICTSGFEVEGKNKEAGIFKGTFECVADISPECDTLPWHILYPKARG